MHFSISVPNGLEEQNLLKISIIQYSNMRANNSGISRVLGSGLTVKLIFAVLLAWKINSCAGGMDQFLRDTMYSIQSGIDRGFLTVRDTPERTYKIIQPEPWKNEITQKWMVYDFQSIGLYDFTPVIFNTTDNMVTFEPTKNVYTYKRQWNVTSATTDKYIIRNPESGWCLTSVGSFKEVSEKPCHPRMPMNQLWKFRMLKS